MKSLAVLLTLALIVVAVHARHYTDKSENEKRQSEDISENIEPGRRGHRHRRQWDQNYNRQPYNPYASWNEYDQNKALVPQIWRLLDEISVYVRRPPPPPVMPQPIYVPYPVPYPVVQNCTCNVQMVPNVTTRFDGDQDLNRIWGTSDGQGGTNEEEDYEDDGGDGSRPISFEPIKPLTQTSRPMPAVEHGSEQASNQNEERVPAPKGIGFCTTAVLQCCTVNSKVQQKGCFTRLNCGMTYARGNSCSQKSINAAIKAFQDTYSPLNKNT